MKKETLIVFAGIGLIGYATFHDHKNEISKSKCYICGYRGLIWLGSCTGLGTYLAFTED